MRFRLALVALAGLAACSPARVDIRTVVLDIEHSAFVPAQVEVERGETVRFVVRNGDPIDHELIIADESVQELHESGTEKHHGTKPGEVSVRAREEATTTYTFEDEGVMLFGCHLPGHYDYGMRGVIKVSASVPLDQA